MTLEDALALVSNCRNIDAEQYRRLEAKFGKLVDWINGK